MKTRTQRIGIILASIVIAASASADAIQLADGRGARHSIFVVETASPQEKRAAGELASVLQEMTGHPFQIVHERPDGHPVIAVGAGAAHVVRPDLELDYRSLGDEGIVIQSHGSDWILTGGEGSSRGTLYAVFTFLEDQLGCRWWSANERRIPKQPELRVGPLDIRYVPVLEYREPHFVDAFDAMWALRNRINGNDSGIPPELGGRVIYAGPGFVHTFGPLVPHQEHFEKHPEWFAEVNGRRVAPPEPAQLCLTNGSLLEYMKIKVHEIAQGVPAGSSAIISISPDDHPQRCQCAECLKIEEEEGAASGPLIRFVNAIADAIKDDYPRIAIDTLAYNYTNDPPKHTKPRDNVIIRLCSDHCSYSQPMSDPANSQFAEQLRAWTKIARRVYVWDYVVNFHYYLLPHPNIDVLAPNVAFLADEGTKGFFSQGNRHSRAGEFIVLRQWMLAKMMWNPKLDGNKVREQFLNEYYEDAAPLIDKYISNLCEAAKDQRLSMVDTPLTTYLSAQLLADSDELLRQAEQRVESKPEVLHRVRGVRTNVLYAIVRSWSVRKQHVEMLGQTWPFDRPYAEYAIEFWDRFRTQGITRISESGWEGDLWEWLSEVYNAKDITATLPQSLEGASRQDWIVFQDSVFWLNWRNRMSSDQVEDPKATDGSAAAMPATHSDQAIVIRTEGIAPTRAMQLGKWAIYADVRIERKSGKPSSDGAAFSFGVQNWAAPGAVLPPTVVKLADISGEEYQLIQIGIADLSASPYVWFAPALNENIQRILVDRVIFVRQKPN